MHTEKTMSRFSKCGTQICSPRGTREWIEMWISWDSYQTRCIRNAEHERALQVILHKARKARSGGGDGFLTPLSAKGKIGR